MKLSITVDEDIMNLVHDILTGTPYVTRDKRLVYKLSYQMRPLRKNKLLTIARDVPNSSSVVVMNGKPKKIEKKPLVFGGYSLELLFPTKRPVKTD